MVHGVSCFGCRACLGEIEKRIWKLPWLHIRGLGSVLGLRLKQGLNACQLRGLTFIKSGFKAVNSKHKPKRCFGSKGSYTDRRLPLWPPSRPHQSRRQRAPGNWIVRGLLVMGHGWKWHKEKLLGCFFYMEILSFFSAPSNDS